MEQYGTIWNNMEQYGTWSSFQFRASEISGVQLGNASPHFAGFTKDFKSDQNPVQIVQDQT